MAQIATQAHGRFIDPEVAAAIDSLPNELNECGFDAWGFRPSTPSSITRWRVGLRLLPPRIFGIENVPAGRVLIVPNHSGPGAV